MILFINTNSKDTIKFIISDKSGNILGSKTNVIDNKDSQKILELLEKFLNELNINIKSITNLVVVNGPGINMNFRIGIIVANTIAYGLNIPIIGVLLIEFNTDEEFVNIGIEKINRKEYTSIVMPEYLIKKN